ncbi:hypothetical protein [Luteitalea pratensis]|uniref:hypothetical protein n=1 Tax=Luteitalea pratensis TaxID=1855912 RepID=UPI0012FFAAA2|nr:hypothetical protein [Luteitalea pratensis]
MPRAVPSADDPRVVTARRVFRGALAFNTALTLFWGVGASLDLERHFSNPRLVTE